ncbi:MAG: asparagine synthase (glutamine-hydrolyzing) [Candidatus Andersenbacteria bacterium]|nr:asparagine synthase (glutamine-hydrolyzing) [Candidatus Andersenbacteria bacterium]
MAYTMFGVIRYLFDMCGIVGVMPKRNQPIKAGVLEAMRDSLSHRGPDDGGLYMQDTVGLGHRRLSILDLTSAGHQPMLSQDGRYVIVFNGEIYNYRELAKQYLSDISFVSGSDTEVLLELLARYGQTALPWLRGMFAFALWDTQAKKLLLACDPFGKKPLFYADSKEAFLFASEPKAFKEYPGWRAEMDLAAASHYFLHEYVPSPNTGFKGVQKLLMGSVLEIGIGGDVHTQSWWKPSFIPKVVLSEGAALQKLDSLLTKAVERRMVSDVPVGIFLSGGLDSTTIAWYMKKQARGALHSCSIGFDDRSFDETSFVRLAADSLQTTHHSAVFGARDVPAALAQIVPLMDVPLSDASLLPTYAVSKLARAHMKVVLSGDGADELFGGYGTFTAEAVGSRLDFLPAAFWQYLEKGLAGLPVSHDYFSFDFKAKSFVKGMKYKGLRRNQVWLGSFSEVELRQLLAQPGIASDAFTPVDGLLGQLAGLGSFDRLSAATVAQYLQDDILVKLDRASMMSGLEARTPFLDVDLAEFVMKLPVPLKKGKYLLKKLMRGRIPKAIIDRPKKGFGLPLGRWLQTDLNDWMQATLSREALHQHSLWNTEYVEKLIQEHERGQVDGRKKLWTLIMFQLWWEYWIAGERDIV